MKSSDAIQKQLDQLKNCKTHQTCLFSFFQSCYHYSGGKVFL